MAATCFTHPGSEAVASCHGCLKPICRICTVIEGSLEYCPACAVGQRSKRSRRAAFLGVGIALVVLVAGGGAALLALQPKPAPKLKAEEPPPQYGSFTYRIASARKTLEKEPCDKKVVLELSELLLKGDAPRETIATVDAFTAKCGDYERLTWDKYTAHKRLAEYAQAADAAGKLMELDPVDHDYPWWRAEMLAEQGKLEEAAVDYRLALSLEPRMKLVPTMLADTLFKLGRPCDARGPLEQLLYFHPEQRTASGIATRLGKIDAAGCDAVTAEGGAVFTLPKGGSAITARVKVNGKALGTFIVDTGATSVVLSKAFAAKAGVDGPSRTVKIRTAAGIREGQLTTLSLVEAQGTRAKNVEAVISDGLTDDGLLGLSYLTRFDVFFDARSNTLTLKPLPKPK